MRSHRAGHYSPIEETLALLALSKPDVDTGLLATDSGFAAGPVPAVGNIAVTPGTTEIVAESNTVTVVAGDFILINTSVEYDAGPGNGTAQLLTQFIEDNLAAVWDTAKQALSSAQGVVTGEVVSRSIRLGPVGAVGQPAPGTYKYAVFAQVGTAVNPQAKASNASIVVMVTNV